MRHSVDMTILAYESVDIVYGHLALTFSIGRVGFYRPSYDRRGTRLLKSRKSSLGNQIPSQEEVLDLRQPQRCTLLGNYQGKVGTLLSKLKMIFNIQSKA